MKRITTTVTLAATLALGLAACGGNDSSGSSGSTGSSAMTDSMSSSMSSSGPMASSDSMSSSSPMGSSGAMTDARFGPGCASVPADGKGSFAGMAKDPVATAAGNNPLLSTLVTAVKKAGLVDTLNNSKNITVFAPSNSAFDKIPKADLDKVLADKTTLTHLLTHHVVPSRLAPAALAGTHPTLNSDSVKVTGTTPDFDVAGAKVLCGNVQTANATVYIVDTVLMPMK